MEIVGDRLQTFNLLLVGTHPLPDIVKAFNKLEESLASCPDITRDELCKDCTRKLVRAITSRFGSKITAMAMACTKTVNARRGGWTAANDYSLRHYHALVELLGGSSNLAEEIFGLCLPHTALASCLDFLYSRAMEASAELVSSYIRDKNLAGLQVPQSTTSSLHFS